MYSAGINNRYSLYKNQKKPAFSGGFTETMLQKGDKALNENKFKDALYYYKKLCDINPDEISVYKKLAKTYYGLKDYQSAEDNYKIYLNENPDDIETIINLGRAQLQAGKYKQALISFEKAHYFDKSNDLAKRLILETKNHLLSVFSPERARREKAEYALQNLKQAVHLSREFLTPQYMSGIKDVNVKFGKTASMGGTDNIAQYENSKKTVTVSNSYIYAAPQVIAAYLSHEFVHARDNDTYTSIREEQDAYETAAKFWIKYSNGVKDPEMDYAAELYKQSPKTLSSRVAEIYKLRDPYIPETSPNHPPDKIFHRRKEIQAAASGHIRAYNVIA